MIRVVAVLLLKRTTKPKEKLARTHFKNKRKTTPEDAFQLQTGETQKKTQDKVER
jgi:hypothetical protein